MGWSFSTAAIVKVDKGCKDADDDGSIVLQQRILESGRVPHTVESNHDDAQCATVVNVHYCTTTEDFCLFCGQNPSNWANVSVVDDQQ